MGQVCAQLATGSQQEVVFTLSGDAIGDAIFPSVVFRLSEVDSGVRYICLKKVIVDGVSSAYHSRDRVCSEVCTCTFRVRTPVGKYSWGGILPSR